jgi:hypothetical protein
LKLTKLEKYIFVKFPVTGYKISLKNFDDNIDKIYLHEETLKEVNFNEEIDIASLDPIIWSNYYIIVINYYTIKKWN